MLIDWITTFEALKNVYIDEAYSNIAINEAVENHKGCSSGFVRMFTKGVIRDTTKLDFYIDKLASKGLKGIKKRTLIIIRMGIYAINSLDSVPPYAAINEAVSLSKKVARGTDGFVNAILRGYLRRKEELDALELSLGQKYSFPAPVVDLLKSQYSDETEEILKGLNNPPDLVIRCNSLKQNRDELIEHLEANGLKCESVDDLQNAIIIKGGNVVNNDEYKEGLYSIQSLSSIKSIEAFAPQKNARVLDMCAAPGGKSCMMSELMEDSGEIIACDIHPHRLKLIEASAKRLGLSNIKTMLLDGTSFKEELSESFDFVLADVPCSGLGVIGSKPELKLRTNPKEYDDLVNIQTKILENAFKYLKPGGKLMYSTCTINKNENEGVVDAFLGGREDVQIVEKCSIMPYNNKVGFFFCIMRKNIL